MAQAIIETKGQVWDILNAGPRNCFTAEGLLVHNCAIILDHAGNSLVHGLPDDDREWSLADRPKKAKGAKGEVTVRQCTECFFVYRPAPVCPQCGHRHVGPVRIVETVEGTLQEVKRVEAKAKRREQGKAQTLDELREYARRMGYKEGWAYRVYQSRQGRRAA